MNEMIIRKNPDKFKASVDNGLSLSTLEALASLPCAEKVEAIQSHKHRSQGLSSHTAPASLRVLGGKNNTGLSHHLAPWSVRCFLIWGPSQGGF